MKRDANDNVELKGLGFCSSWETMTEVVKLCSSLVIRTGHVPPGNVNPNFPRMLLFGNSNVNDWVVSTPP